MKGKLSEFLQSLSLNEQGDINITIDNLILIIVFNSD